MTDDSELVLGMDLNLELDDYLLHPQPHRNLRMVHAFMQGDRKIEHVCEEVVPIENGTLLQEKLIWCIKKQQQQKREQCKMHFKLRGMFLYNMDITPDEVQDFLKSNNGCANGKENCRFIVPISALDNVAIKSSIPMFSHLTALHVLYEASAEPECGHNKHSHSKKKIVQIHSSHKGKCKHTRRA
jgi:hypothetical protein